MGPKNDLYVNEENKIPKLKFHPYEQAIFTLRNKPLRSSKTSIRKTYTNNL